MPQKQKLSAEEKAKVIEDYINNRISLSEAARRGGVLREIRSVNGHETMKRMEWPHLCRDLGGTRGNGLSH